MTTIENAPQLVDAPAAQEEETVSYIEIADERYELPRLDDLDLDEEQILYDVGGVAIPDFMGAHPESPEAVKTAVELVIAARTRNPAFKRALVLIAYRRRFPALELETIQERIGKVNGFDAELALFGKTKKAEQEDDAANPPRGT
jgi:hypothetical protein